MRWRHLDQSRFQAAVVSCLFFCGLAFVFALHPPTTKPKDPSHAVFHVVDMLGRTHGFSAPPSRIVFTAQIVPTFVTLTQSLGPVVAVSELARLGMSTAFLDQIFPAWSGLASIGGNTNHNLEEIMRVAPDAVIGWGVQRDALERGGSFEFVAFQTSYPLTESHIALWISMGELSGHSLEARDFLKRYFDKIDAIARRTRAAAATIPVRVLIVVSNANNVWVGGPGHYLNERLELAGAINVARGGLSASLSLEQAALFDPDVILIHSFFPHPQPQELMNEPAWRMLRAVRERKVYRAPWFPLFAIPIFDPLLVQWLAEVLHPDAMPVQMRTAYQQLYKEVYGYELSDQDIDQALFMDANGQSFEYGRFSINATAPSVAK